MMPDIDKVLGPLERRFRRERRKAAQALADWDMTRDPHELVAYERHAMALQKTADEIWGMERIVTGEAFR